MDKIHDLLTNSKTIAIIGLSPKPERPSNDIARYLIEKGYTIIPINPGHKEILNEKCYKSLEEVPSDINIDIVNVFRKSQDTPNIARSVVLIKPRCLWLQLGIHNEEAKKIAEDTGLIFVQDKCIKVEHMNINISQARKFDQ